MLTSVGDPFAKLDSSRMSDLLAHSELIVQALAVEAKVSEDGSGSACMKITRILKGRHENPTLMIRWSAEVHDQRVDVVGRPVLLFLRRLEGGGVAAAHYGCSYWPIEEEPKSGQLMTPYIYPIDTITMDVPELLRDVVMWVP
ncbi:MAG: hypothetical protein ACREIH_02590, partial [Nitrospiraceae bacterium]